MYVCKLLEEADLSSARIIVVFVCLMDYSLQTVVIRLCRNFRDRFGGGLNFRHYETKTPKFTIKINLT